MCVALEAGRGKEMDSPSQRLQRAQNSVNTLILGLWPPNKIALNHKICGNLLEYEYEINILHIFANEVLLNNLGEEIIMEIRKFIGLNNKNALLWAELCPYPDWCVED